MARKYRVIKPIGKYIIGQYVEEYSFNYRLGGLVVLKDDPTVYMWGILSSYMELLPEEKNNTNTLKKGLFSWLK